MADLNASTFYDLQHNAVAAPSAEPRTSYFDVLTSSNSHHASYNSTFVTIIAGQFTKDVDRVEYVAHYQKFFKKMQTSLLVAVPSGDPSNPGQSASSEKITGILLAYRTSFIHVLECPQKIMYAFLNDVASLDALHSESFNASSSQPSTPIMTDQARILFLSDDIKQTLASFHTSPATPIPPQRNFPFWASKIIDGKEDTVLQDWALMDEQGIDDQITSVCVQLLKVGQNMSQMNKADMKHAFEDISERYKGQIPSQTLTFELGGLPQILSVKEWQLEFQGKMKVTLESELVWPTPKPLILQ